MYTLALSMILAAPLQQAPPVKYSLQQAPPMVTPCDCMVTGICLCGPNCPCELVAIQAGKTLSYDDACRQAMQTGKPMVTFVGCQQRQVGQRVVVSVRPGKFAGYPQRCIIVGSPEGGMLAWRKTLPIDASDQEIMSATIQVRSAPAYNPSPMMMQPMFFGGFGGGGGRGGGGGC